MKNKRKNILAISGSTRQQSSNMVLLHLIEKRYQDALNVEIFNGIDTLPHFNPDLDTDSPPMTVMDFRNKIDKADGVIICTPEYVFSLPGALKNALEWTVSTTVFSNKPVAIIVASGLGEKAFESLQLIMKTIEADLPIDARLLFQGFRSNLNENGQITDPELLSKLDTMVASLVKHA